MQCPHKSLLIRLGIILAVLVAVTVGVLVVVFCTGESTKNYKGSIVTNGHGCAQIGTTILEKGGSAVDATIAALFCEGVSMPQSMGLGGGFLMTIYDHSTGKAISLNAREVAPKAATRDMYKTNSTAAQRGGTSVAVPGELRGYWWAYKRFGVLPWKELVQPTIDLCENGVLVTEFLAKTFASRLEKLSSDDGLREVYIDPKTHKTYLAGEKIKMLKLAKTLRVIAEEGGDALNNGSLTEVLAKDIQDLGGIITSEDLRNYKPQWLPPATINLPNNLKLYTVPLPGSGVILSFILNILGGFLDNSQPESVKNWQRIVEGFKFGYGKRTELGDVDFVNIKELVSNLTSASYAKEIQKHVKDNSTSQDPAYYGSTASLIEDHGTAHVSVLAPNGDAVSVTSTINFVFGAAVTSINTGIILNDEMDDFSSPGFDSGFGIPPSPSNYIEPGKRPISSMCPTIIVDSKENKVRFVTGAAGGTKITTSVALVIIKHLWFEWDLKKAMDDKRLHHQLYPMYIEFEESYGNDSSIVEGLAEIGHVYNFTKTDGFSAVTSISQSDSGVITSAFDKRRPGDISYLN